MIRNNMNKKSYSRSHFENNGGIPLKCKRSQITIFVIIALLIVISIGLIIYANPGKIAQSVSVQNNPHGFIQGCARDAANDAVEQIIPNGGILNPAVEKYIEWQEVKPIWMCYTANKEQICTNLHPMLRAEIEKQIYDLIKPKIDSCFSQLKNEFESYDYTEEDTNLELEIAPSKIYIKLSKKISYIKNGIANNLENFNTQISSPLYDFVIISNDIVNQEVNCDCRKDNCNADIIGINRDKREYETTRDIDGYNNKIYSIKEVASGDEFNFAVRNCVRLPY